MTKIKYQLGRGCGNFRGEWDDAYIDARDEAELDVYVDNESVIDWLEENLQGKYKIEEDYVHDSMEVSCFLYLVFEDIESEMAYKLVWSELC